MTELTSTPVRPVTGRVAALTRFALRHRRLVVTFWLLLTVAGIASVGSATKAFTDQFSVPGREGWETNAAITKTFGNGGDGAPLVAVVDLPRGSGVDSPVAQNALRLIAARIGAAVPHVRIASYATTGDPAFVSRDGRTTFLLAYPRPRGAVSARTRAP